MPEAPQKLPKPYNLTNRKTKIIVDKNQKYLRRTNCGSSGSNCHMRRIWKANSLKKNKISKLRYTWNERGNKIGDKENMEKRRRISKNRE